MSEPLAFEQEFSEIPDEQRHERLVEFFGRYIMWVRNRSLKASRKIIESEAAREQLGTIRRKYYDGVANLPPESREAAMRFLEESLNTCLGTLLWFLGHQGTDCRLGTRHAYRFRIEMEIVDVDTNKVVHTETINRGGEKFFGSYWGRWLNRFRDM